MTPHVGAAPQLIPSPGSPAADGFRMPAEWEPHRATWLIWPHNRTDWEPKTSAVQWCYAELVRLLVDDEAVCVLFADQAVERRARARLRKAGVDPQRIERYRIATDRSWIRDSGPIFVVRSGSGERDAVAVTDWKFNGWARFRSSRRDNLVAARVAQRLGLARFAAESAPASAGQPLPVVLEGGCIDVDGQGSLLATEECLLGRRQARNPLLSRRELEQALCNYLGARHVLWLGQGIAGDDTHGHVDAVARFVAPGVVAAASEPDPADENHGRLADNLARLSRMTTAGGRPLRVVEIPMPGRLEFGGRRLPASYLNFYIANRRVLVPTFNDPRDRIALALLAPLFPGREVVGVHAVDLVLGCGAVHCVTQQEPAIPSG